MGSLDFGSELTDARPMKRLAVGFVLAMMGCNQATPKPDVAPTTTPVDRKARDDGGVDLEIAFHPGFTGDIGWSKLPERTPLHMVGTPGAKVIDGTGLNGKEPEGYELERFARELKTADLANASLVVQRSTLCSDALREAVNAAKPERLLMKVKWGLTAEGVACLGRLEAPRIYLAGCLYREHRPEEGCDGDAELAAVLAEPELRERVFGFALSLGKPESVLALAELPNLEYLALVPSSDDVSYAPLPWHGLGKLQYLDASHWGEMQLGGEAGRLHTIRWNGRLRAPLEDCKLRRFTKGRIRGEEVATLAGCSQLEDLSIDSAKLDSVEGLAGLDSLESLYLRHLDTEDLSPLAGLKNLRVLGLGSADATDFSFVAELDELEQLDLSQTSLASLEVARALDELTHVDIGFTAVNDLTPLAGKKNLKVLDAGKSKVVDLAPIATMPALEELKVGGTGVRDLSPLADHPSLRWVIIHRTAVTDISVLSGLPALERANIRGLALPPAQVEALKSKLGRSNVDD